MNVLPAPTGPSPFDRREAIKRGALVVGAAWTAPVVLDSIISPAAAATTQLDIDEKTPGEYTVVIPPNRIVEFTVIGGGGGGGGGGAGGGTGSAKADGASATASPADTTNQYGQAGGNGQVILTTS